MSSDDVVLLGFTEEDALKFILEQTENPPRKIVSIPRLGMEVTIQAFMDKEVERYREQCTFRKKERGKVVEDFDSNTFSALLITGATKALSLKMKKGEQEEKVELGSWGNKKLLSMLKVSTAEEGIKRILLAGEISALGEAIMDLSGYNLQLDDVKN